MHCGMFRAEDKLFNSTSVKMVDTRVTNMLILFTQLMKKTQRPVTLCQCTVFSLSLDMNYNGLLPGRWKIPKIENCINLMCEINGILNW